MYASALADEPAWSQVPAAALSRAEDGVGLAFAVVESTSAQLGPDAAAALSDGAVRSFMDGLQAGCLVAAGVTLVGSLIAALLLPSRPEATPDHR
jgi:hypothetical protein